MVKYKRDIIYISIIILSIIISLISLKGCNKYSELNKQLSHNIEALSDTVKYYYNKNGQLVAEKKLLIGDIETLKITNDDLYNDIKSLKIKNTQLSAKIDGIISNPIRDTVFKIDSIYISGKYNIPFEFSDKYRLLSGFININENNIGLNINTDIVYFNYTLALSDNTLYITSDNPYVKIQNISGINIPKKTKRWAFSLNGGLGIHYNFINNKFGVGPYLGIGGSFNF